MEKADWFFDIISPFGYLHFHAMKALHGSIDIQPVPVLLAGLLKHWDTKGPAEVPPKRLHTYQYCVWKASELNLPFRMPRRHPFNSLKALRLLVAIQADLGKVSRAFDFVYGEGHDPELEFDAFAESLGVQNAHELVGDPAIKQQLLANTSRAISAGAFGVPSLVVRGRLFWGSDTVGWTQAFLNDPKLFEQASYVNVALTEFGVERH